ncbi:MAG: hypothetical protein R3F59_15875 [Myxococcota bacterium]
MNRRFAAVAAVAALSASVDECTPVDPEPNLTVAQAHAPVHYQDTDSTCTECDWITAIDYDGNWTGTDNWDHLFTPSAWGPGATGYGAVVYTSVVETCTHWFVVYGMFHPRDWTDSVFDQEHENDLEGALVVVEKDGTPTGRAVAMITVYHNDFYSYVPEDSTWTDGDEDIDGVLSFEPVDGRLHPVTAQQAKGHGLKAWPYAGDFAGNPGEDGVRYVPTGVMEVPTVGSTGPVGYALEELFEWVWPLQIGNFAPYAGWGALAGDDSGSCGDGVTVTCAEDAAHLPWSWDDTDDGSALQAGLLGLDPALLVDRYFDNVGDFSLAYRSNRYLEDLRAQGYDDGFEPAGFPSALSLDAMYARLDATCP